MWKRRQRAGQTLVEALVAIGILTIAMMSVALLLGDAFRLSTRGVDQSEAASLASEGINALKSIAKRNWLELVAGTHGLATGSGYYTLSGASNVIGDFTRQIIIENVNRDGSDNIVLIGGSNDDETKKITSRVTWVLPNGGTQTMDFVTYVTEWFAGGGLSWLQTTVADFLDGFRHGSVIANATGGEVEIGTYGPYTTFSTGIVVDLANTLDASAVAVDNRNNFFIGKDNDGGNPEFYRFDVSNSSNGIVTQIDTEDINQNITAIAVSGDYAFIGTPGNSEEIYVYRLSTSSLVNTWNLTGNANVQALYVVGSILYVGRASAGGNDFMALSIANPLGALSVINGTEISGGVNDIAISGNYAFLGTDTGSAEFKVVRLSDYVLVNTFDQSGGNTLYDVRVSGTVAYAVGTSNSEEVLALNISAPEGTISSVGSVDLPTNTNCRAADLIGTRLFVGCENGTIHSINTAGLTVEGSSTNSGGGFIYDMVFADGFIYTATATNTAEGQIMVGASANGWGSGSQIAGLNWDGYAYEYELVGNTLFVAGRNNAENPNELLAVNVSTPASPSVIGGANLGSEALSISVTGNYAFLGSANNSQDLRIYNISTPSAPSLVVNYDVPGGADVISVDSAGNYVYLGRSSSGHSDEFVVVNVSTPATPTVADGLNVVQFVNDVVADGNYVYLLTDGDPELLVIDVTNPNNISQVASLDFDATADPFAAALMGDLLVVTRQTFNYIEPELVLVDVSTPTAPTIVGTYDYNTSNLRGVWAVGDLAYVVSEGGMFLVFDISSPSSPVIIYSDALGGAGRDVVGTATHAYTVAQNGSEEFRVYQAGTPPIPIRSPEAKFRSQIFDAGSSVTWDVIKWTATLPGGTSVQFQIRTSATLLGVDTASFVGPDGTVNTFYTTSNTTIVTDPGATGTRYVQWQLGMTTTGSSTPSVEDVTLDYF